MNSARRVALTAATVVVTLASTGCGPAAVAPSPTVAPAGLDAARISETLNLTEEEGR